VKSWFKREVDADALETDVLDSKTKKLHIELPNYSFRHSPVTSGMFLGRKKLKEQLIGFLTKTSTHKGIYLVTGDRGVGKTSLVEEVIKETSLSKIFPGGLKFLVVVSSVILVLQLVLWEVFDISIKWNWLVFGIILVGIIISAYLLGIHSYHKRKNERFHKRNTFMAFMRVGRASVKEFLFIQEIADPLVKSLYFLKLILIVCVVMLVSGITDISPIKIFIVYTGFLLSFFLKKYIDRIIYEQKDIDKKFMYYFIDTLSFFLLPACFCLVILDCKGLLCRIFILFTVFILLKVFKLRIFSTKKLDPLLSRVAGDFSAWLLRYIRNGSRIYIKINFGQEEQSKRDILRLIARNLQTSYFKYCSSFKHTLLWRATALAIILLFTFLFHNFVYKENILPAIESQSWYQQSSQKYLIDSDLTGVQEYEHINKRAQSEKFVSDSILHLYEEVYYMKSGVWIFDVKSDTLPAIEYQYQQSSQKKASFTPSLAKIRKCEEPENRIQSAWLISDRIINHICKGACYMPAYFWNMKSGKCTLKFEDYHHPPINYAFWLILFFFYLLGKLTLRIAPFTTPLKVKRHLKYLNDNITYSKEKTSDQNIGVEKSLFNIPFGIHGGYGTRKSRKIADEGEIEMELQAIFTAMQAIPFMMSRPEWVIVFDELDKMEPQKDMDDNRTKDSILSIHAASKKQAAVLKLLSNMKYFLSTAEAQFIFIAGREMYDIYLADISERSNLLGSIFNNVVFVPSFLSEYTEDDAFDMTSMVEKYVCTHIIPSFYTKFSRDLKGYKQYLDRVIYYNMPKCYVIEHEKQKIIACLQQFIFYLAYTSKGAPQKMVQIFESYIQTYNPRDLDSKKYSNTIHIKCYRKSVFFLTFDYYDQFMLGMTSYLVAPVMYRFIDSNIQKHSDKLLVSSLRYIDFMFKFHSNNFSWKSLDISPELIEVNRAPELKSIAESLTNYLLQIHIDKSYSGLYEYRFDNLISQEISFMSKVCEQFSAMFNFSLDESLILKHHYKELLKEAEERMKDNNRQHSIASLQVVLGDLHFYDDEFEEAASYYKDGIQSLPPKNILFDEKKFQHVYIYIRNMLKLGFVYEKRKQYGFASLTYSELCNDINKHKLGCQLQDMRLIYLPFLAKLQILEKCHTEGIRKKDIIDLTSEFGNMVCGMKNEEVNILSAIFYAKVGDILYYKNRNFETKSPENNSCSACFYYQKAISKLLMYEHKSLSELLSQVYSERKNNANVKYCSIMAQILSNWGDVFFACDGCKGECRTEIANQVSDTPESVEGDEFWELWHNLIKNSEEYTGLEKILYAENFIKMKLSVIMFSLSMKYYKKAADNKRAAFQITRILHLFRYYMPVMAFGFDKTEKYIDTLSNEAIRSIYAAYEGTTILEINKRKKDFEKTQTEDIPLQTILVDSEIKRIIILVKSLKLKLTKRFNPDNTAETLKDYYKLYLTSPYGINYSVSARIFRLSLKSTLNWETYVYIFSDKKTGEKHPNHYKIIFAFLRENFHKEHLKYNLQRIFNRDYKTINLFLRKIFDQYYEEQHKKKIDDIFGNYYRTKNGNKLYLDVFEKLIAETIFCFKEIIRLSKTVGATFLFNHSLMGDIYYCLSFWTSLLESYLVVKQLTKTPDEVEEFKNKNTDLKDALDVIITPQINQQQQDIQEKEFFKTLSYYLKDSEIEEYMKKYLGTEWRENISGYYDRCNALIHYYQCKEAHEEGKAYFEMTDDMYYLNEDFSDRSNHFYIAMDRYFINSKKFTERLNYLKDINHISELHNVDNYF
jgi:hypothetical protein